MKFDKKKLLILGSNTGSEDIVCYARNNGAKVIVADYYPIDESPAKKIADETLLISTADVEQLVRYVKENHVDGVFAGISEFNLLKAMEISEKCGLSFYCNRKQWVCIEQKNLFRKNCIQNKVPVPKTYFIGEKPDCAVLDSLCYPVVIKPIDASASMGVHICNDKEELEKYEHDALSCSNSKTIIIEKYIEGDEFTAHYTIRNGKACLSCIDNRYPVTLHEGNVTTIPVARVYPSLFIDEYIQQVDRQMVHLCEGLDLKNAVIFIQGIYNKNTNQFAIFEAGLRIAAEAPYRFINKITGFNSMNFLVDTILLKKTDDLKEDPYLRGSCCGIVSFVTRGGKVGSIIGLEETLKQLDSVVSYENRYPVGTYTPDGDTLKQLMLRFVMVCKNRKMMERDVAYLNSHIQVLDTDGINMVVKFKPERLFDTK